MTRQSSQTTITITLECDVVTETDKAILLQFDGHKRPMWFPKSQVELHESGLLQEIELPRTLAIEKGLI